MNPFRKPKQNRALADRWLLAKALHMEPKVDRKEAKKK
jgi:hypothetical protein